MTSYQHLAARSSLTKTLPSHVQFTTLQRPASLVEEVCRQLATLIRSRTPGQDLWLPAERSLAENLGVSRTVVREATKRLEQQGMLKIQHGTGIQIVDQLHRPLCSALEMLIPNMPDRLTQLTQARLCVEPEAAALAAVHARAEHVERLLELQEQLAHTSDTARAVEADMATHRLIADASGNVIFRIVLDSLAELGSASRMKTIGAVGTGPALDHHRRIIDAIRRRDSEAAREEMRNHILAAAKDLSLGELFTG